MSNEKKPMSDLELAQWREQEEKRRRKAEFWHEWKLILKASKPVLTWSAALGAWVLVAAEYISRLLDWGSRK